MPKSAALDGRREKARKAPLSATQLAENAVRDMFAAFTETTLTFCPGSSLQPDLSEAFENVERAVETEERRHDAGDDDESLALHCAREAGYLIGVQVGLKLRRTDA